MDCGCCLHRWTTIPYGTMRARYCDGSFLLVVAFMISSSTCCFPHCRVMIYSSGVCVAFGRRRQRHTLGWGCCFEMGIFMCMLVPTNSRRRMGPRSSFPACRTCASFMIVVCIVGVFMMIDCHIRGSHDGIDGPFGSSGS